MKKRWPFLLIGGVLLAWAGYLALGAYFSKYQPTANYVLLKPLIIFGCMGAFLAFWWFVFTISAKRRAQKDAGKPK